MIAAHFDTKKTHSIPVFMVVESRLLEAQDAQEIASNLRMKAADGVAIDPSQIEGVDWARDEMLESAAKLDQEAFEKLLPTFSTLRSRAQHLQLVSNC